MRSWPQWLRRFELRGFIPAGGAANMKAKILLALAIGTLLLPLGLRSQTTPATVVVPAQVAAPVAPVPVPAHSSGVSSGLSLKFLQEMKAANDGTLKAQAAQLAALDELQKAAEELKIFSKRG